MKRRELGVIMKTCVAALSAAVALTAMPTQVNAAAKKTVTVSTQKSLNAAMKDEKVTTIVIKTSKDINVSIPKGKYTSKSVEIIAPKVSLINNATLKGMTVKSAKIVTEKADNNKIIITDKGLKLIVPKGADNSKISIGTKDAKVTVVADGKVSSVAVNKKALVSVTGTTTKPVTVTSNAPGTGLILSAKSNIALKQPTTVNIKKGANIGTITAYKNAIVDVVKGAKVNIFKSIGNKSSVKIDADGTVNKVELQKKASVTITGDTTKPVEVDNNAAGTVINLAAKARVNSSESAALNALRGAIIEHIEATKTLMLSLQGGSKVKEVTAIQDIILKLAKGSEVNSLTGSKDVDIKVAKGAKVDAVKSQGEEAKVTVTANGTVGDLVIDGKAEVTVEGTTTKPVNVTSNAADAVLSLSAAANITLNESATVNVTSGAKVESLIAEKDVTLAVAPKATVTKVVVKGPDAKIEVTANGTLGTLTIDAKADVSIKGKIDKPVVVNANVESAKITTQVKTEVKANANVDIILGAGAEGSKVVASKNVNALVKNETKENVTITDSTGKENTVGSGSTGDTKPTPPVYVPSYYPVETITMTRSEVMLPLPFGETSTEQLKVDIFPTYATEQTVIWESENPEVATVSSTGLVTPVTPTAVEVPEVRTAVITATVGSKKATCTVYVVPGNTVATVKVGETVTCYKVSTAPQEGNNAYSFNKDALLNAVEAANKATNKASIVLLQNVILQDETINFMENKNGIIFDLNGKIIKREDPTNKIIQVLAIGYNNGLLGSGSISEDYEKMATEVELIDTSGNKGSIINAVSSNEEDTDAVIKVNYLSKLTIDDGIHITYDKVINIGYQSAILVRGDERAIEDKELYLAKDTSLVVKDALIDNTTYGISAYGTVTVTINGGVIKSDAKVEGNPKYAVGGNGTNDANSDKGGTNICINGGIIDGGGYNAGIYQPQNGHLEITGGTISGASGIDVKLGTVAIYKDNLTGQIPTIKATPAEYYSTQETITVNDGANAVGYAVAVVERAEYGPNYSVEVDICDGIFEGAVKMLRYSEQPSNSYILDIVGGKFNIQPSVKDYEGIDYYTVSDANGILRVVKSRINEDAVQ